MSEVICAGIVIADVVARPVTVLPERGKLALVDEISLQLGGSAANTGAQLVRLGQQVSVAGRVGRDSLGRVMRAELQRLGVGVADLQEGEAPTSATVVQVDSDGERSFLHSIGASAALRASDFPLREWRAAGARLLHVAGYHILPGLEPELPELFAQARALGFVTSLDCVWDASGEWGSIRHVLPQTDLFCPSLAEARGITGLHRPPEVAAKLFDLGVRQALALKMGERGSLVQSRDPSGDPGEPLWAQAPAVVALDGTGAGDSFIAGFLAAYLRGLPLADMARLGNAAGGLCASALGGTAGLENFEHTWALARTLQVLPWHQNPVNGDDA